MTTLAVDAPRDYELGDHNDLPVIAGDVIFEGAAVGLNSGGYTVNVDARGSADPGATAVSVRRAVDPRTGRRR